MRIARPSLLFDEASDSSHLEGAPDLIERVSVVADNLARLGHVPEFFGQLEQGQLPSGTLRDGHSVLRSLAFEDPKVPRRTGWSPFAF